MSIYFVDREDVLNTLRKLVAENRNNMAASIIYKEVINEAIDRIMEIKNFEYQHLACSILFAERERLKLTDDMIYNFEVEMKSGKKYKISCEVVE